MGDVVVFCTMNNEQKHIRLPVIMVGVQKAGVDERTTVLMYGRSVVVCTVSVFLLRLPAHCQSASAECLHTAKKATKTHTVWNTQCGVY